MMSMQKTIAKSLSVYLLLLAPSLLIGMFIWYIFIDGKLYYCSDKVPFFDFIPPFVHKGEFGTTGDYYIVAPIYLWATWFAMIMLIISIPYMLMSMFHMIENSKKRIMGGNYYKHQ